MDPTEIGSALGQAQDVQTVLGIVITMLLIALLAVVKFWLDGRKSWATEKLELKVKQVTNLGIKDTAAATAVAEWERERANFIQRERDLVQTGAEKTEELMREMMALALGVERALDQLHKGRDGSSVGGS